MTIGPAPIIKMLLMSVRFGITNPCSILLSFYLLEGELVYPLILSFSLREKERSVLIWFYLFPSPLREKERSVLIWFYLFPSPLRERVRVRGYNKR